MTKLDHVGEFGLLAEGDPVGMIKVLFASLLVVAGRLEVAVGQGADPHILPHGRDHQLGDAVKISRLSNGAGLLVQIHKTLAAPPAGPAPRVSETYLRWGGHSVRLSITACPTLWPRSAIVCVLCHWVSPG